MITLLESGLRSAPSETNDSFVEVVIGGGKGSCISMCNRRVFYHFNLCHFFVVACTVYALNLKFGEPIGVIL